MLQWHNVAVGNVKNFDSHIKELQENIVRIDKEEQKNLQKINELEELLIHERDKNLKFIQLSSNQSNNESQSKDSTLDKTETSPLTTIKTVEIITNLAINDSEANVEIKEKKSNRHRKVKSSNSKASSSQTLSKSQSMTTDDDVDDESSLLDSSTNKNSTITSKDGESEPNEKLGKVLATKIAHRQKTLDELETKLADKTNDISTIDTTLTKKISQISVVESSLKEKAEQLKEIEYDLNNKKLEFTKKETELADYKRQLEDAKEQMTKLTIRLGAGNMEQKLKEIAKKHRNGKQYHNTTPLQYCSAVPYFVLTFIFYILCDVTA